MFLNCSDIVLRTFTAQRKNTQCIMLLSSNRPGARTNPSTFVHTNRCYFSSRWSFKFCLSMRLNKKKTYISSFFPQMNNIAFAGLISFIYGVILTRPNNSKNMYNTWDYRKHFLGKQLLSYFQIDGIACSFVVTGRGMTSRQVQLNCTMQRWLEDRTVRRTHMDDPSDTFAMNIIEWFAPYGPHLAEEKLIHN